MQLCDAYLALREVPVQYFRELGRLESIRLLAAREVLRKWICLDHDIAFGYWVCVSVIQLS